MAAAVIELLDRQYDRLQRQEGAAFVHELKAFHAFVSTTGPPAIRAALQELREDALRIEREFAEHDDALVPELVSLKGKLVRRVPESDDSNTPRPPSDVRRLANQLGWAWTLANFDELAHGGPDRLVVHGEGYDRSTSRMLLRILEDRLNLLQFRTSLTDPRAALSDENLRPELDDLQRELRNLGDRHRHAANIFTQAVQTHGGAQVQLLDWAVDEMNPSPVVVESHDDEHALMEQIFGRLTSGIDAMEAAAAGRQLSDAAKQSLAYNVDRLKQAAEKVFEAVRLKVATSPPPAPTLGYGQRLRTWVLSPGYALVGGPCIGAVVTQLAQQEGKDVIPFLVLAVAAAVLPPFRSALPTLTFTRVSIGFVVVTCTAVVVALVAGGLPAAFLVFLLALVGFGAGVYADGHRGGL